MPEARAEDGVWVTVERQLRRLGGGNLLAITGSVCG